MKLSSWYDYSQLVYVDMTTDIIIGCPIHGDFKQLAACHKRGANCPYCAGNTIFNPKNKEETKKYWLENEIVSGKMWIKHWKYNNLRDRGYLCNPWRQYKITCTEWVKYVCGKKETKSKEETKKYWLDNGIRGSTGWKKHWEGNDLRALGYLYSPWESYKMICGKWTEYVWGERITKTKEETKEYWLDNEITGSSVWTKHWRGSNLPGRGYSSNPWRQYKMTKSEWVEYVHVKK